MTLYQQGSGPPTAHTEAGRAQELISCLVGVAYAEVVGDARGSVREVRVWTTGQFPTQQTVRNVESAGPHGRGPGSKPDPGDAR